MLNNIYTALTQFFFPSRCPSCNAYTEQEGQWCPSCFTEILRNKNLAYDAEVRQYISPIITIGKYDKGLRHLIHELKYSNNLSSLIYIQPLFDKLDEEWQFTSYDMFIPVPLHDIKFKKRGFNQVEKIFFPWIKKHKLPYHDILLRCKQTKSQYKLNRNERQLNLQDAFMLKPHACVKNKHCLLLDDIFTSGATLESCAQVLLANGATKVSGLVLASKADD